MDAKFNSIDLAQFPKRVHKTSPMMDIRGQQQQQRKLLTVPVRSSKRHSSSLCMSSERIQRARAKQQLMPAIENTYQIEPLKRERLCPIKARDVLYDILEKGLRHVSYDPSAISEICSGLTDEIKGAMKKILNERYKFVCFLVISENRKQNMRYVSRSVWDTDVDNYMTANYKNASLSAIATVFATYYS